MHQHAHGRRRVIHAVVVALQERPVVPQARPHRLYRLVDAVFCRLVGILGLGRVQPGPVEGGQVLVVGAGAVAQRRSLRIRAVHLFEGLDDPVGRGRLLDLLAQLLEFLLLLAVVRLEVRVGQHLGHIVVQVVGLHEFVVEVERHREPLGHGPLGQIELAELGRVGRLDPERVPVVECHICERRDLRDRQIPPRSLLRCRPSRGVMVVHLLLGGGAQGVSVRGHGVVDVLAYQSLQVLVLEDVADEGVGHVVLDGAQVDVGQRRLRNGADRPGHPGQVVGQRLVDGNVGGTGLLAVLH